MKLSNLAIVYIRTLKSSMVRFSETWNFRYKTAYVPTGTLEQIMID